MKKEKAIKQIEMDGVIYDFKVRNLNTEEREQTDVYEAQINGVVKRAYLTCKIPAHANIEEVYTPALNKDCIERMIRGEVVEVE